LAHQSKLNRYTTLNTNEREFTMPLTPSELLAMVASVQSDDYDQYEANWEELESDDGHIELYED